MARILPPLLGTVSADLSEVFREQLRNYAQTVRDRGRLPRGPKVINDPIWRTIRIEPWEIVVLDSPVVQRLRGVRQLGLASYVFPGAGYSRFEHSIGVLHQAQRFIDAINRNSRTENPERLAPIQPADEVLLRLAALLHDVGHGFLSHVSERAMLRIPLGAEGATAADLVKAAKRYFGAEGRPQLSEVVAALIVLLPDFVELLSLAKVPRWTDYDELADHLAHLIVGTTKFKTRPFLREIVSGVVDADKLDYMARDCYMAGLPMPVDVERLLEKIHVVSIGARKRYAAHARLAESEAIQVFAVQLAGGRTVEELLLSRVLLYEKLYHHQKIRAFEGMVENAIDLLVENEPSFKKLSSYLSYSDAEFLGCDWRGVASPEPAATRRAREVLVRTIGLRSAVRAFVFGSSFIKEPSVSVEEESDPNQRELRERRAQSDAWRKLVPLVTRDRTAEAVAFRGRVVARAKTYLSAAGQETFARTLDAASLVIDLPEPQGIAARTNFWVQQGDGVVAYSEVARADKWMEAYEAQKTVGFVHCQPEHADAVHLAFRDLVFEECGLIFDARSIVQTKLDAQQTTRLAQALITENVSTRPVTVDAPERLPVIEPALEAEIQALYGPRIVELATRFQNYRSPTGPSIDANLIFKWLVQFDRDKVTHAVRILEHVRFWDRQALADALAAGIGRLTPADVDSSVFVPFGGAEKSSHSVGYLIPEVRLLLPDRKVDLVASANDITKSSRLIFFDDICASGKQASTGIRQLFGLPPEDGDVDEDVAPVAKLETLELLKNSRLTFLFITGSREGLDTVVEVAKHCVGHGMVDGHLIVPDELDCFQPAARIFVNPDDAQAARTMFKEKGRRSLQDKKPSWTDAKIDGRSLGYGSRASLTVFYYNCPSSTLTALWKKCNVTGSEWMPLFQRRSSAPPKPVQTSLDLK